MEFFLLLTTTFLSGLSSEMPSGGGERAPRPVPRRRGDGRTGRATEASPLPSGLLAA